MSSSDEDASRLGRWQLALVLLVLLAVLPFVLLALALYGLSALLLQVALWLAWVPFGRRVLFVYSDSPVWQEYIEENILPRLPRRSVILNWSQRRTWNRWTLSYWTFRFFAGTRELNPLAIVVRPLRWVRVFRFWRAFRDFKHGRAESLRRIEHEFLQAIRTRESYEAI